MKNKKMNVIVAMIMAVVLVMSLTACGKDIANEISSSVAESSEAASENSVPVEAEPLVALMSEEEALELARCIYMSESGKDISEFNQEDNEKVEEIAKGLMEDDKKKVESPDKPDKPDKSLPEDFESAKIYLRIPGFKLCPGMSWLIGFDDIRTLPYDANLKYTMSIEDTTIAELNGYAVTGLKVGKTNLVITASNGYVSKTPIEVVVEDKHFYQPKYIELSSTAMELKVNDSGTLTATVYPEESASTYKATYTSGNKAVATVSDNGVITAKSAGTAIITVKAGVLNPVTATCKVTVVKDTTNESNDIDDSMVYSNSDELISFINQERTKAGLSPLTVNTNLNSIAAERAVEIKDNFSHSGMRGCEAEIITTGWDNKSAVANWMNSAPHKAIILSDGYLEIGAAGYQYANGKGYFVALFKNSAGVITKNCKITGPTTVTIGDTVTYSVSNLPGGYTLVWEDCSGLTNNGDGSYTANKVGSRYINVTIYKNGKRVTDLNTLVITVVDKEPEAPSASESPESTPPAQNSSDSGTPEAPTAPTAPEKPTTPSGNTGSENTSQPEQSHPSEEYCDYCGHNGHTYGNCPQRAAEEAALHDRFGV